MKRYFFAILIVGLIIGAAVYVYGQTPLSTWRPMIRLPAGLRAEVDTLRADVDALRADVDRLTGENVTLNADVDRLTARDLVFTTGQRALYYSLRLRMQSHRAGATGQGDGWVAFVMSPEEPDGSASVPRDAYIGQVDNGLLFVNGQIDVLGIE